MRAPLGPIAVLRMSIRGGRNGKSNSTVRVPAPAAPLQVWARVSEGRDAEGDLGDTPWGVRWKFGQAAPPATGVLLVGSAGAAKSGGTPHGSAKKKGIIPAGGRQRVFFGAALQGLRTHNSRLRCRRCKTGVRGAGPSLGGPNSPPAAAKCRGAARRWPASCQLFSELIGNQQ